MDASNLVDHCETPCEEGAVHACGMQWRPIGQLCDIPFSTLYGLFARLTRLGLGGAAERRSGTRHHRRGNSRGRDGRFIPAGIGA
jgi:hypothetical protein